MRNLALGLMSGTSMDGIDVAIIDVHTQELVLGQTFAYPEQVAKKLKLVMENGCFDMHYFAQLNREVGIAFADAAYSLASEIQEPIQVIGSHGQTICHQTDDAIAYTWQLGCPYSIYEKLKVPVVFDFRSHNVVQGGQGAPLAPLYHQHLFGHEKSVAVINIGGISNISLIREGQPVVGFDMGPGNCLLDAWIAKHQQKNYDAQGLWAQSGMLSKDLLDNLLTDAFFQKSFPKSIGKEYFSLAWLEKNPLIQMLKPEDVQATLLHMTAFLIAQTVSLHLPKESAVYICGGGVKNQTLMGEVKLLLADYWVQSSDKKGISSDYLEAMMMAWLGACRIQGIRHDISSILGGSDQQLLGLICQ
jgi:anhydro-N-acetylmuramic acid kinase